MSQDAIDEIVEDAFATADSNKDDKISFAEFAAWVCRDKWCLVASRGFISIYAAEKRPNKM